VTIATGAAVATIETRDGRVSAVVTEDGMRHEADLVASSIHPQLLVGNLLAEAPLPQDFRRRIGHWQSGSGTFRMNLALDRLPDFTARPNRGDTPGDHLTAGIIIAPSLDYMDRAYLHSRSEGWSREPIVEMLIASTLDPTLAPEGQHVASLFCQQFAPELPDGRSWDDERDAAADLIIDTVESYAPGFRASVIARQIHSPLDLERKFGLIGGDIMHGAMSLDQLWSARPVLGNGGYRGPLKGLYMCGAGTHPGGGVTGAPGHNAAQVILSDASFMGRLRGRG